MYKVAVLKGTNIKGQKDKSGLKAMLFTFAQGSACMFICMTYI